MDVEEDVVDRVVAEDAASSLMSPPLRRRAGRIIPFNYLFALLGSFGDGIEST